MWGKKYRKIEDFPNDYCGEVQGPCIKEKCHKWTKYTTSHKNDKGKWVDQDYHACTYVILNLQLVDLIGSNTSIQKEMADFKNETVKSHTNVLNLFNTMRYLAKKQESDKMEIVDKEQGMING